MTGTQPSPPARMWRYRFTQPDGSEVETSEFSDDASADARARELSKSQAEVIVVHRHSAHVDDWEYVTEVDERP